MKNAELLLNSFLFFIVLLMLLKLNFHKKYTFSKNNIYLVNFSDYKFTNNNKNSTFNQSIVLPVNYKIMYKDTLGKDFQSPINDLKDYETEIFYSIKSSFLNKLDYCGLEPANLIGNFSIKDMPTFISSFSLIDSLNKTLLESPDFNFLLNLKLGGSWEPSNCKPRHRVAIVIPYKNRLPNLNTFLFTMHPYFQRQELGYTVFVVEQINDDFFNKGILMNAAFLEIEKMNLSFSCIIMHDVDLIPSDDLNLYSCPLKPRHYSILVDKFDYRKSYPILVGGVLNFRFENFKKVNGYSNVYWGWGAEDDDMYYRLKSSGVDFERPVRNTIYTMLQHKKNAKNPERSKLLHEAISRYKNDGISSVKYNLQVIIKYSMFTHILVDVGSSPMKQTATKKNATALKN